MDQAGTCLIPKRIDKGMRRGKGSKTEGTQNETIGMKMGGRNAAIPFHKHHGHEPEKIQSMYGGKDNGKDQVEKDGTEEGSFL